MVQWLRLHTPNAGSPGSIPQGPRSHNPQPKKILHATMKIKDPIMCLVTQLCPTLCNPMDRSLPGSSVHGNSPGKNTDWSGLPFPSPEDLPNSGIGPRSPSLQKSPLLSEPPGKPCVPQLRPRAAK